jgi:hypothetical protein
MSMLSGKESFKTTRYTCKSKRTQTKAMEWSRSKTLLPPKKGEAWQNLVLSVVVEGVCSYLGVREGGIAYNVLGLENRITSDHLLLTWRLHSISVAGDHHLEFNVHRPFVGIGNKVSCNLTSPLVEVAINLWRGIVGFDDSNGLFGVFGEIEALRGGVDDISELILNRNVTEALASRDWFLDFHIVLTHRSIFGVILFPI